MTDDIKEMDLFQSIFESSVEGILVVGENGSLLKVNPALEHMFGYGPGELNGAELEKLIPEENRKKHENHRRKYAKNPMSRPMGRNLDLYGLKKNGTKFPIKISLSPAIIKDRSITIAFVTDATEPKIIEHELKTKEAESKALLEAIPDMMVIQNFAGDIIDFYSPEQLKLQTPLAEIIGKNIREVVPPKMAKSILKTHDKAIKTDQIQIREYSLKNPNGKVDYEARTVRLNNHRLLTIIRDITEIKRTEQELKDSQVQNKALLDALPDMIFILNEKGEYLDLYAPNAEKLLVPKEEVIGKNLKEIMPSEVYEKLQKSMDRTIKQKETQIVEYSLMQQNAQRFYEARIVFFNNNKLLSIVRDITEKKRTEQALKESVSKNKAILEALPDLIIIHDKNGKFLDIQVSDPGLLLAPKEEIIGKNVKDILPGEQSDKFLKALSMAFKTKTIQIIETTLPGMDRIIDYEARIAPLEEDKLLVILRDITKTKIVKDVLFVRNRALEVAGNGIVIVDAQDPNLPIIYSNKAFSQITGYGKDEVIGRNCRFLQKDDRSQEELNIIREAIKEGRPCNQVLRNYKKDGTMFWNDLTITPLHNEHGLLTHFIGVQSDVTLRKKAGFLKDQIRLVLEMIAQHHPLEAIGNRIIETVEKYMEDCFASIFLLNQEKGTLHNLSAPSLPKSFMQTFEGLEIGPTVCSCGASAYLKKEVTALDIEIDPFWKNYKDVAAKHKLKSCWSFPILSSNEEVLGTFAIYSGHPKKQDRVIREMMNDFTYLARVAIEQHNTRITIQENRKQLATYAHQLEVQVGERTNELRATVQKLVETNLNLEDQIQDTINAENKAMASQLMFATIAKNFPKGAIAVINEGFKVLFLEGEELNEFDIKSREIENMDIDQIDLFTDTQKSAIKESVRRTLDGQHLSFEIKFNKNTYTVNTTLLGDKDENEKQALFVYHNITDQKKVELEILNALHKEQELNELKSRFISMASHEFRTPLSAILSSAILIGKQNEPGKELKREKYIEQIKSNVRNLVVILNDFLSLSKLEEGKIRVHPEHFDIIQFSNALLQQIEIDLKPGQKITIKCEETTFPVFIDPKLTRHILLNLLNNSVKYSDANSNIELILEKNDQNMILKVKDQGIGIAEEEQTYLFERFFRAKNSTNIQGTGLGLHIAKQCVELMGGTIGIKSQLNVGSTFIVELPIRTFESTIAD